MTAFHRRLAFPLLALLPVSVLAHGLSLDDDQLWSAWNLTFPVTLSLLFTLLVYLRGCRKRARQGKPIPLIQSIAFTLGTLCFFTALQSPIEALSDHFLFIHQIEHLLLRIFGPLLTILAMPLAPLIQGLPGLIRHRLLAPLIRSPILQLLYRILSHPLVATMLFLATLVFWQIPHIHDRAVQDPVLHDLMHITMIISGFFFWWLIADPRKTARLTLGLRLIALWVVTVPNSLLGAYITLYKFPLYAVYDVLQGRWNIDRLLDQQLGGLLIWGPGAMMGVIGTGVIFVLWVKVDDATPHSEKTSTALT